MERAVGVDRGVVQRLRAAGGEVHRVARVQGRAQVAQARERLLHPGQRRTRHLQRHDVFAPDPRVARRDRVGPHGQRVRRARGERHRRREELGVADRAPGARHRRLQRRARRVRRRGCRERHAEGTRAVGDRRGRQAHDARRAQSAPASRSPRSPSRPAGCRCCDGASAPGLPRSRRGPRPSAPSRPARSGRSARDSFRCPRRRRDPRGRRTSGRSRLAHDQDAPSYGAG